MSLSRLALPRVRTAVTVALLILGGLSAPALASDGSGSSPVRTGVYRGSSGWGAERIPGYEAAVGRRVDYALDFQASDSWSNLEWPDWQAGAWQGRTVVLGATGIFPGSWDRRYQGASVGWAQAARGDYDASWRRLGERLVAKGQSGAVLRGAHEFNGGWFAHRVHPDEAADFVTSWRRWVTIMRSVPGQHFTFDWNPTVGSEWPLYSPEMAYPGDDYVDHVALDVYDGWYGRGWKAGGAQPTTAERDAVWDHTLNGPRGLRFWRDFARAHGKKLSLPEWGLRVWEEGDGLIHGGGDNAAFVERMAALIQDPAWGIDYEAFWEDPGKGVSDADPGRAVPVPEARRAYLAAFGPQRTSEPESAPAPSPVLASASPRPVPMSAPVVVPAPVGTPTPSATRAPAPAVKPTPSATRAPATIVPAFAASLGCSGGIRPASAAELPLSYSWWSDRSWAAELSGRTVSRNVFAWVPTANRSQVAFRLDDRAPRVDRTAPFDLVDGHSYWAEPLQVATLSKGPHRVTIVARTGTACVTRTATFTVA